MKKKILMFMMLLVLVGALTSCAKKFKVNFDTQGGSEIASVEVKKGKKVDRPSDPTKEGYVFVEWKLNGEAYDFNSKVTSDITLVAEWLEDNGERRLSQPKNVRIEGNKVVWDKVDGASGYEVYVNGTKYESSSESYEVSLGNLNYVTISIVAKSSLSEISSSEKSNTVLLEKKLSEAELLEILGSEFDSSMLEEFEGAADLYNRLALAIKESGIKLEDIQNAESPLELLAYVEEGKTKELVTFLTIYLDSMYEAQALQMKENLEEPQPGVSEESVQALYDTLKGNRAYVSTIAKAKDDAKFMNLVLPAMTYTCVISSRREISAFSILRTMANRQNEYGYSIIRKDDNITFTNIITDEVYTMTLQEIQKLADYYYQMLKESNYEYDDSVERKSKIYYSSKLSYLQQVKMIENCIDNTGNLFEYLQANNQTIADTVEKIYNVYTTILGYEEKYLEIVEKFNSIESPEQLSSFVQEAREFAIQVSKLVEDNLPSERELELVQGLIVKCVIPEYLIGSSVDLLLSEEVIDLASIAIEIVRDMLSVVESITAEDIEAILALMSNPNDENAMASLEKVLKLFTDKLSANEEIKNFGTKNLLQLAKLYIVAMGQEESILSLMSISMNVQFTEEELKLIEEELESISNYFEGINHDFSKLEEIFSGVATGNVDMAEIRTEANQFIDYALDYVKVEHLVKYEKYIKALIASLEDELTYDATANKLFNVIKNNLEGYREFARVFVKSQLYIVEESQPEEEKIQNLRERLTFIKNEFTNEEAKAMAKALYEMESVWNDQASIEDYEFLNDDFQANMDKIIACVGKDRVDLTDDEINLIDELDGIFECEWVYPSTLSITYNVEKDVIEVRLSERFTSEHPEVALSSFYYSHITARLTYTDSYSMSFTLFGNTDRLSEGIILEFTPSDMFSENVLSCLSEGGSIFFEDYDFTLEYQNETITICEENIDMTEPVMEMYKYYSNK